MSIQEEIHNTETEIERLQQKLFDLRTQYRHVDPDVQKIVQKVKDLDKELKQFLAEQKTESVTIEYRVEQLSVKSLLDTCRIHCIVSNGDSLNLLKDEAARFLMNVTNGRSVLGLPNGDKIKRLIDQAFHLIASRKPLRRSRWEDLSLPASLG